jgi:Fe-S-cluster containining protein
MLSRDAGRPSILGRMARSLLPSSDQQLVQIVDAAFADAARRSGEWLLCRPGCTQCCHGVFAIHQLDVERLQNGLRELEERDPERAGRVKERARAVVVKFAKEFPGDPRTGILDEGDEAEEKFEEFANDEPCPVLDPATGTCDLYAARPMTCRVFGPPVRSEGGLGVCELCYHGATTEEIAACEMVPDSDDLESRVLQEVESSTGQSGRTIVAYAITRVRR